VPRSSSAKRAVLLDALGTLVELEPPAPFLVAEIASRWQVEISVAEAEAAFAAEIGFYKAHHLEGRDDDSLAALRQRCAGVLHGALPAAARERIDPGELVPAMLASLRFRAYADVPGWLAVLRAAGLKLAVVSNWDVSLGEVLQRVGIAELLDCVATSAAAGAAKPDPAPFELALECLGMQPEEVVHLGDSPALDLPGAAAAGIEAVLISRRP
jgi:putative hydrolase of the HAD superfamily